MSPLPALWGDGLLLLLESGFCFVVLAGLKPKAILLSKLLGTGHCMCVLPHLAGKLFLESEVHFLLLHQERKAGRLGKLCGARSGSSQNWGEKDSQCLSIFL